MCSALGAETLFGLSFLFTRKAMGSVSPLALLSWRFLVAFIVMLIMIKIGIFHVDFHGKALRPALLISILHPVIYFIGETYGVQLTSASESGTIIAAIPVTALLGSTLIIKKKPSVLQICGISTTLLGVLCVVLSQKSQPTFSAPGYLLLFMAVIAYSLFSVFASSTQIFTPVEKAFLMIASGCVVFTLMAVGESIHNNNLRELLTLPFTNHDLLIAVLYLSLGSSILAFIFDNNAIAYLGTNGAASFIGLCTFVTVVSSVIILREPFSKWQIIGTILIIGGVYIANSAQGRNIHAAVQDQ